MLKLIIGVKGTGKTKSLINLVNAAVESSHGNVVCIEKGDKLTYDVKHQARLIDTKQYFISNIYPITQNCVSSVPNHFLNQDLLRVHTIYILLLFLSHQQ